MNLVTIYDVRNGWTLWVAGGFAIAIAGFGLWMLIGTVRVFRIPSASSQRQKNIIGMIVLFASIILLFSLSLWFAISDYFLRADLNTERFLETEGVIEGAHIESGGRSNPMYFRVGETWFILPYEHPQDCYPHNGERTKVSFEETATSPMRSGTNAHIILRMLLTHQCRIAVWG